MKRAGLTRPAGSLAVFSLAPDLSFEYGPSLAFGKNTTVLQSTWFTAHTCLTLDYQFINKIPIFLFFYLFISLFILISLTLT